MNELGAFTDGSRYTIHPENRLTLSRASHLRNAEANATNP